MKANFSSQIVTSVNYGWSCFGCGYATVKTGHVFSSAVAFWIWRLQINLQYVHND